MRLGPSPRAVTPAQGHPGGAVGPQSEGVSLQEMLNK